MQTAFIGLEFYFTVVNNEKKNPARGRVFLTVI